MSDTPKPQQAADGGCPPATCSALPSMFSCTKCGAPHGRFKSTGLCYDCMYPPKRVKIRKAFVCVGCDFVYCDEPPTSCDCMNNPPKFIKGEIRYSLPNANMEARRE